MIEGRIHFPGNPWPEGHALREFEWAARTVAGDLRFNLHLISQDYDAEREIEDDEDDNSWASPGVWGNYHKCILSSTHWGEHEDSGFRVCGIGEFSPEWLDGRTFEVDRFDADPAIDEIDDLDERPFQVYLLGHDSVVDHRIRFSRVDDDRFDIHWSDRIALSYSGSYTPRHLFEATIRGVRCPRIPTREASA